MSAESLELMLKAASEMKWKEGELLFNEGEPANRFFLLERGLVALEAHEPADGEALVECVRDGEVFGWSWLFPPFTWHLRARALEPTTCMVIDGGHLLAEAERCHDFGYDLMKRVAQVVIHRLQAARRELLKVEAEEMSRG